MYHCLFYHHYRDARLRSTMRCHDLQLLPSNNSHFYVTTNIVSVQFPVLAFTSVQ